MYSPASVTLDPEPKPLSNGLRREPSDLDPARRQIDEEEHGKPRQTSTVKKSTAARTSQWVFSDSVQVVFFTRSGACSRPCSRRMLATRASADLMTEVGQGPLDPRVDPVAVFRGHAHHQRLDFSHDGRSSQPTTCAPVVLLRDQPTMPGQQGVRA